MGKADDCSISNPGTFLAAFVISSGAWSGAGFDDFALGALLLILNLLIILWAGIACYNLYSADIREHAWRRALTPQQMAIVNVVMRHQSNEDGAHNTTFADGIHEGVIELTSIEPTSTNVLDSRTINSKKILNLAVLQAEDVRLLARIGQGSFGEVFKGVCMGQTVAVKTMLQIKEETVKSFRAEILMTATLRHPNIVNFIGACWSQELMCLVLEVD